MKKVFPAFAGALILVLAGSCSTTWAVWDPTVPPEKSATVSFYGGTMKSYNGIGIDDRQRYYIIIPAGEAVIGLDIRISHGGVEFLARDMEITCYLEGGQEYTISGDTRDGQWGVNLYQGRIRAIVGDKALGSSFLQFIPFKNQPDTFG
jgi:hypothetical protein